MNAILYTMLYYALYCDGNCIALNSVWLGVSLVVNDIPTTWQVISCLRLNGCFYIVFFFANKSTICHIIAQTRGLEILPKSKQSIQLYTPELFYICSILYYVAICGSPQ